jgi:putative ABC transport system substrate-binding protein
MERRAFISLIAGVAVWPLYAHAQQKPPIIGFLGPASAAAMSAWTDAFVQRLRELGWIEGRTVVLEYRWADGRSDRLAEIAAEFVRLKVDLIVTTGTAVPVLKKATSTIPIVFTIANDPVGGGLVASLSRPGGNATGLSQLAADLGGKRIEILREIVPSLTRLATLSNATNPVTATEMDQVQEAARRLGLEIMKSEISRAEDIAPAIEALKGRAEAMYIQTDPLMNTHRVRISTAALGARLPTLSGIRAYVEAGGLMSYGPNFQDLFRRAAEYADKILRGAKPADLPVEQPTKFDLVFNLTTAKVLGLKIMDSFLIRADEVMPRPDRQARRRNSGLPDQLQPGQYDQQEPREIDHAEDQAELPEIALADVTAAEIHRRGTGRIGRDHAHQTERVDAQ